MGCICGKQVNFCCSSKRTPVTAHGNHYHRPGCEVFNNMDKDQLKFLENGWKNDKKESKCEEC